MEITPNNTLIIIPTYNEKENIKAVIREIMTILPNINILVVDDNSPDGTAKIVKDMMAFYPGLFILERKIKTGLGDAYKEAIKHVLDQKKGVKAIITMDADGSHQPKYLRDFFRDINDYDLLIGSRYTEGGGVENWEFWRRMLSKFGNIYAKSLVGTKVKDLTAGFLCFKKDLAERINFDEIDSTGYAYLMEFKFYCINKLGAKAIEIPIVFKRRFGDESKMSKQIVVEGIRAPLRMFMKRLWK